MTAEQIILKTRSFLDDRKQPYLWEDEELVDYLNEAIKDFARETRIIKDRTQTPTTTQVSLLSNLGIYDIGSSIMTIQSAMVSGATTPITLKTESWMDAHLSAWRTNTTPTEDGVNYLIPQVEQGTLRYIQVSPKIYDDTGEIVGASDISFVALGATISKAGATFTSHFEAGDSITITGTVSNNGVFTVATVAATSMTVTGTLVTEASTSATIRRKDGTLTMTVIRYPISEIVLETISTQTPEIPSVWHIKLRDGIAMYAYEKDDADTYNKGKAERARARFMGTIDEAKRENIRKYHAPGPVEVHSGTI